MCIRDSAERRWGAGLFHPKIAVEIGTGELVAEQDGIFIFHRIIPDVYKRQMLERVEIFKGANSLLNGAASSGVGGMINLEPKPRSLLTAIPVFDTVCARRRWLSLNQVQLGRSMLDSWT